MKTLRALAVVHVLSALSCEQIMAEELDATELEAIRVAANAYADAWLTNDADTVMATFVDEPVLSPSGLPYLEGQEAARNFWFAPDSPSARVTEFDMRQIEVTGSGNLAYVRGTFRLAFEYDGQSHENHGKYVTILRKGPDGAWRISHHIWDDFPQTE